MKHILIIISCFLTLSIYGQDVERISVNGRISVASEDKEGVTVFNTTTNKGTITDENGEFTAMVTLDRKSVV